MSIQLPDEELLSRRGLVYRDASRAAGVGLLVNIVLVFLKITGGIATGSAALIADAVNSIGDVAGSVLVRGALWIAQRDADEDHPYGHTKAESIAGLTVSVLIVFSALALGVETIRSLAINHESISYLAVVVGIVCAVIKESLYWYTIAEAKRLSSSSLRAVAWDHRSDAFSSAAIAVALLVGARMGTSGWLADRIAAIAMCIVLIATGLRIYRRTAMELMDQQADCDLVERVALMARAVNEVCDVETLRVRKSGLEFFVEIHVEVDGHLTVHEGHRIGHVVKDTIMRTFPRIRDVLVHVEPFSDLDRS
jgi:cation diffusion facilitator family transporter